MKIYRTISTLIITTIILTSCFPFKGNNSSRIKPIKYATVTGQVLNENNEPLPGISVLVDMKRIGAMTDSDGFYRIKKVPIGTQTLVFTSLDHRKALDTITIGQDTLYTVENMILIECITRLNEEIEVKCIR